MKHVIVLLCVGLLQACGSKTDASFGGSGSPVETDPNATTGSSGTSTTDTGATEPDTGASSEEAGATREDMAFQAAESPPVETALAVMRRAVRVPAVTSRVAKHRAVPVLATTAVAD